MGENNKNNNLQEHPVTRWFRNAVLGATMADLPAMMTASGWRLNEKGDYVLDLQNDPHVKLLRDNLAAEGAGVMLGEFGLPAIWGMTKLGTKGINRIGNKTINYFKDKYGKEVIPTPYPGPDSDLVDAVNDALLAVLRDYFSSDKTNQIKKTMNWGDLEISELLDEILRTIGNGSEVLIKGPKDGFTIIGEHEGKLYGTGADAEASHLVTLNRERIPDLLTAQEAGIHELGVHGKTASMQPEDFGKGGYSDNVKTMFPRLAEITLKNKELADALLVLNKRGLFLDLFKNVGDLEKYFVNKGLSWEDKWDKFYNNFKYYKYTTKADEKTARAYTGQLFNKVFDPNKKTLNIELLERFYTPESVEAFKKAVLGVAPVATATSLIPSDKKGSKILIKKKNRGKFTEYCGGEVTDECILKAKKSKNPKLRKRATFAANARGWAKKHLEGGEFNSPKITLEQLNLVKDDPKLLESLIRLNMRDYARAWYSERSKLSKYEPLLSGNMDLINTLLDLDRYFPMKEVTTMLGNKYPVGEGGFEVAGGFVTRDKSIDGKPFWFGNGLGTLWHEGIGHWIGNLVPGLLSKRPNSYMRYLHPEYDPVGTYEKHINKNDEMLADIWEFRGLNRNLRDTNGKLYIDPNRQLTPKDVEEMLKNPKFRLPGLWKNTNINSESIANMHNTFADASINKNNEGLFAKRGSKLHKPNNHRSVLDNGWIPTLRLKKGTYGLIKKK